MKELDCWWFPTKFLDVSLFTDNAIDKVLKDEIYFAIRAVSSSSMSLTSSSWDPSLQTHFYPVWVIKTHFTVSHFIYKSFENMHGYTKIYPTRAQSTQM